MTHTLRSRFLAAEEQLLSAFLVGQDTVHAFGEKWTLLLSDYTTATKAQQIDTDTMSLAQAVASRIVILARTFLSLDADAGMFLDSCTSQCADILSQAFPCDATGPVSPPSSTSKHTHHAKADSTTAPSPLHSLAHSWLLQNLDNPYPSSSVKIAIATGCGSTVADVQDWFADARRRIGWTALSGEKFGGSRRLTAQAASRAYAPGLDDELPADIRQAFGAIQVNARRLSIPYSSPEESSVEGRRSDEVAAQRGSVEGQQGLVDDTPSSDSVIILPPSLCHSHSFDEEDTTPPPPIAGCKRRVDVSVDSLDGESAWTSMSTSTDARPAKRHRSTSLPMAEEMRTSLTLHLPLTPPLSIETTQQHLRYSVASPVERLSRDFTDQDTQPNLHDVPPYLNEILPAEAEASISLSTAQESHVSPSSTSRKRRLSDSCLSHSSKRPRASASGHRKQTVSDPLPSDFSPYTLDAPGTGEWFERGIDDFIASSFGVSPISETACGKVSLPPFTGSVSSASQLEVPDSDLVSMTSEGFDLSNFDVADPFADSHFNLQDILPDTPSDPSSISSSPSIAGSSLDQSAAADWRQFMDIFNSFGSSPTSSVSSLSDDSNLPHSTSNDAFISSTNGVDSSSFGVDPSFTSSANAFTPSNNITDTPFGMDPSFTPSNLLTEIGELSSLLVLLDPLS